MPVLHTFTLDISGSGSVSPVAGTHNYEEGSTVEITALPEKGWQFDGWIGDVADSSSPDTAVTLDSDKTVTARFSPVRYTLNIQVIGNGSTSPSVGNHSYNDGLIVSITALPEEGWQFDGWIGEVTDPDLAVTTVTMESDKTFTADFSEVKPRWWLIGSIMAGIIVMGVIVWLEVTRHTA